jgi:hypothetical protein
MIIMKETATTKATTVIAQLLSRSAMGESGDTILNSSPKNGVSRFRFSREAP